MKTLKIGKEYRSSDQGLFINSSELVKESDRGKDFKTGICKYITTSTSGGVLVKTKEGKNNYLPSVPEGTLFPVNCIQILNSGDDWQGNNRTSVSGDIWVFGAE